MGVGVKMVTPKWILQLCRNLFFFYSGILHMTLECKDTTAYTFSPLSLGASQCL
jgi:hypothetical protein